MPFVKAVRSKSHGYVYRVLSITCGRMMHLQSRGEYYLFHPLDMLARCRNLREGFALPLALTKAIAKAEDIKHPFNRFTEEDAVMSVDFLCSDSEGGWLAIDYKPSAHMIRNRVRKKLRITTLAFAEAGIDHVVVTDTDLPAVLVLNLGFLHTFALKASPLPLPAAQLSIAATHMKGLLQDGNLTIYDAAVLCDREFRCGTGRLVRAALWSIARNLWSVNLDEIVDPDHPVDFRS